MRTRSHKTSEALIQVVAQVPFPLVGILCEAGRAEERCPVLDVLDVDDGVVSSRWEDVPRVEGYAILAWKVLPYLQRAARAHTVNTRNCKGIFAQGAT